MPSLAWRVNSETKLLSPRIESRVASEKRLLVLLVSSDTEVQDSVQKTLHGHRHTLVCASTMEKACAILRQAIPNLVIADREEDLEALRPHLARSTGLLSMSHGSGSDPCQTQTTTLTKPLQSEALIAAVRRLSDRD